MNKHFKTLLTVLCGLFTMALVVDATGVVPDTSLLADIIDFFIPVSGLIIGPVGVAGPGEMHEGGAQLGDNPEDVEYFDDDLNKTIVKVRPSEVPLDTLTRSIGNTRTCESWECGGWEIGTRDVIDTVATAVGAAAPEVALVVDKKKMWLTGDVALVDGVQGKDGGPLAVYVVSRGTGNAINVVAVNSADGNVPALTKGTVLIRLSTGYSEKAAQASPYNISPTTRKNYCQIHMAQVEETTLHSLQKKKVTMDFATYKEQAIWDMKFGMERQNFFGVKGITQNEDGESVYLSEGVWWQCPNMFTFDKEKQWTNADYVKMCRQIFDGNNGSDARFLFAGPGMLERLAYVDAYTKQLGAKQTEVVHGVKVRRIVSDFGELLIRPVSSLFQGSFADCGLVLDMNYVAKYVREPLHSKELSLDESGQRRVKAVRLLEDYGLFLENLPTHCRIVAQ